MNRLRVLSSMCFLLMTATAFAARPAESAKFRPAPANGSLNLYIVVLADGVAREVDGLRQQVPMVAVEGARQQLPRTADVARDLAAHYGGVVMDAWEFALHGFLVRMPEARARKLAEDPRVAVVEQDSRISSPVPVCPDSWKDLRGPTSVPPNPLPLSTGTQQTITCANPDPASDTSPAGSTPQCPDNWGLDRSDWTRVDGNYWYNGNNGSNVHVYLLDTGILWSHQEFRNDANTASRVSGGVHVYVNTLTGAVTLTGGNSVNTNDESGHGTHVAAIIAGRRFGVAKAAMLHPVHTQEPGDDDRQISATIAGLDWIVGDVNGVNDINNDGVYDSPQVKRPAIINWSGGNEKSWVKTLALQGAVGRVLNSGIVLVQSAGNHEANFNSSTGEMHEDAGDYSFGDVFPDVIVVGGVDPDFKRWTVDSPTCPNSNNTPVGRECGSITGSSIDLWAPAAWVNSASRSNLTNGCPLPDAPCRACRLSGTSMAAPHVSGAAAIYLQSNPTATAAEVGRALRQAGHWGYLPEGTSDPKTIGTQSDNVMVKVGSTIMLSDTPPTASFTVNCHGRTCTLDGTGSSDDLGIQQYSWQFGDGTSESWGTVTSHLYPANFGSDPDNPKYAVLRVTDGTGKTDHLRVKIAVNADGPPVAFYTTSCIGLTCTFDSSLSSDDVAIASRQWTIGGSTTSTATIVTHTFASWGDYVVSFFVTDTVGQTAGSVLAASLVLPSPANVTATGATGSATVQWTAVTGAGGYLVERKVDGGAWALAANVTGGSQTSVTDVPPSAPYGVVLYRVFAKAGTAISLPSNKDVALVEAVEAITSQTPIRAAHLTQLRKAVNGLLVIGGGTAYFSANDLNVTNVQQQQYDDAHFVTVMQKLNDARTDGDVGLSAVSFRTPPPPLPAQGVGIEDTHIIDLRAGIQ